MRSMQVSSTRFWKVQTRRSVFAVPASVAPSPRGCPAPWVGSPIVKSSGAFMRGPMYRKIAVIGGGGVRTPLLIFGVNEAAELLGCREMVLFDPDEKRLRIMAELGRTIVGREEGELRVREATSIEDAVEGADFVLNSIRVGGIAARAADELAAIKHGYPGQETTGPAGASMALRTVSTAIAQAKLVERLSPKAWIVNFTNTAGLTPQAIASHTQTRVVGICDTPVELFHHIATALGASLD